MGELFTHPLEWRPAIVAAPHRFHPRPLSDIGGITPARKLAALAEAFGVRTALHGPGDVSPVGHAANVHLDSRMPNFGIQEFIGFRDAYSRSSRVVRNSATATCTRARPGLGIDLDEQLAKRYPLHADMAQFNMAWSIGPKPGCRTAR